jgi:hypothetical protein
VKDSRRVTSSSDRPKLKPRDRTHRSLKIFNKQVHELESRLAIDRALHRTHIATRTEIGQAVLVAISTFTIISRPLWGARTVRKELWQWVIKRSSEDHATLLFLLNSLKVFKLQQETMMRVRSRKSCMLIVRIRPPQQSQSRCANHSRQHPPST